MFENVSEELANTILYGRKCLPVMIKMQKNGDIRNNAANISRRSYVSDWNKTSRFFMLLDYEMWINSQEIKKLHSCRVFCP